MTEEIDFDAIGDGFVTGTAHIEQDEKEREEAAKAARAAASDRLRTLYFKDEKGNDIESVVLRFVTEATDVIKVAVHQAVQPKPFKNGKGPKAVTAVCRNDVQVRKLLSLPEDDCYVCTNNLPNAFGRDAKATMRTFGLAALRQEVIGDGSEELGGPELKGRSLGYADVPEKYEIIGPDGKGTGKYEYRPTIVVVMQAWKNFWASIHHAWLMSNPSDESRRTIRDRDYSIKKSGAGTEVIYSPWALEPTPELVPGTPEWHNRYEAPLKARKISLAKHVLGMASNQHYARWFDPTVEVNEKGVIVPAGSTSSASTNLSKPSSPVTSVPGTAVSPDIAAKMAALKDKLGNSGG